MCPNEGITERAAATGHPWPGAAKPASLPVYPLRNTSVRPAWLTGRQRSRSRSRSKAKAKTQPSPGEACGFCHPTALLPDTAVDGRIWSVRQHALCSRCRAQRGCDRPAGPLNLTPRRIWGNAVPAWRVLRPRSQPRYARQRLQGPRSQPGRLSRVSQSPNRAKAGRSLRLLPPYGSSAGHGR